MGRRILVLACIFWVIASPHVAAPTQAQTEQSLVYVALGDSIAFGVGSSLPERRSYPAIVSNLLAEYTVGGTELVNLSVPGETAASFLANGQLDRFVQTAQQFAESGRGIDVISIGLGGNELLAGQPGGAVERQQAVAEFRTTFDEAIARIRAEVGENAIVVLTTYYDLDEGDPSIASSDAWWIEQFNQVVRDTAASHGAAVAEVGNAFRGNIEDFTHHPYDVHPKNQGYRAIARQVWSAIGFDQDPPEVEVTSGTDTARRTPTLQFTVADNVDVDAVTVRIGDDEPFQPVDLGDGRYVLLLDLRGDDEQEYEIVIDARDSAGNTRQHEHRIAVLTD